MIKTKSFFAIAVLVLIAACSSSKIEVVKTVTSTGIYEPIFIDISTSIEVVNPYDQDEIKVDAIITTPTEKQLVLPCFYMKKEGSKALWQARFTPREKGVFKYKIQYIKGAENVSTGEFELTVNESAKKGFLSMDTTNQYFLNFDNGQKFRGIGLNLGWEFEPKWGNKKYQTYEMFFDSMARYNANFQRMWLCPWNLPIQWTPAITYKTILDDMAGFDNSFEHSAGLTISKGPTPVTQNDSNQLLISENGEQFITYKLDSVQKTKMMIYYKGKISKDDFEILCSSDNKTFTKVNTVFSDSWDVVNDWRRIFLFSSDSIAQPCHYVKYIFKNTLKKDDIKVAGIHINYGNPTSVLDCGLDKFSQTNSARFDEIVNYAEKKGIYIDLTLGYHGQFNPVMDAWGANDEWNRNPYNKVNGGPCAEPRDFFSNAKAKKYYKDYLRYMVARWGYSPNIAIWEFWNEIDLAMRGQQVPVDTLNSWHHEMAKYVKSIDPYNHLVTTSLCCMDVPGLWDSKYFDLTQIHRYEPSNYFYEKTRDYIAKYNKPHMMGEYAIGWKGPGNDYPASEYEGEFHNGMWRGLFNATGILPLSWWWDYHIDAKHYYNFAGVATAVKAMTDKGGKFAYVEVKYPAGFEVRQLNSDSLVVVWVKKLAQNTATSIDIQVNADGTYEVQHLNTWTNKIEKTDELKSEGAALKQVKVDLGERNDIALLIKKK